MKNLLDSAAKCADHAEIYVNRRNVISVKLENGSVAEVCHDNTVGHALRVSRNGRVGMASCNHLASPGQLVIKALDSARLGPQWDFTPPAEQPQQVEVYHGGTAGLTAGDLAAMAYDIHDRIDLPDVPMNCAAQAVTEEVLILNTSGLHTSYERTVLTLSANTRMKGSSWGPSWSRSKCGCFEPDSGELEELAERYVLTERQERLETGKMPVFFAPDAMWALTYRFVVGASGTALEKGMSPLIGKQGEQLLDNRLTLVDDATITGMPRSASFDDEGVEHRRLPIFTAGVFSEFMLDLRTSAAMGLKPTGNGRRCSLFEGNHEISPGPWPNQLIWQPGDDTVGSLLRRMDYGLLVVTPMGFHQGNVMQGEYSMNVGLGYVVKGGKPVGRAVDCTVSGNVYRDLAQVGGITRETANDAWGQGVGVLLPEISITGA